MWKTFKLVDGYTGTAEQPLGNSLMLGSVGFVVESKVPVTWSGCDWNWSAALEIQDKTGVDHNDSWQETTLTIVGVPLVAPPTPVI